MIALAIYPLLSGRPRDPQLWAFGYQDNGFAGNSKYLYLWLSLHRPDLRPVWISGDQSLVDRLRAAGLQAHRRWSAKGIWSAARAAAFFFDHSPTDINVILSNGSRLVNLWHGVGIKPIQFNDPRSQASKHVKHRKNPITRAIFIDYVIDPDFVISTSPFMRQHFAEQFRLPDIRCPELGYPRLDCAADPALKTLAISLSSVSPADLRWERFSEHYIYLPTFRDSDRPFLKEAFPELSELSRVLSVRGAVLYIKLHPKSADLFVAEYDNIKLWPTGLDYYPMLADFDLCISDYSSAIFDYVAISSSGAITYSFDRNAYTAGDRALMYSFEDCVPGPWIESFAELLDYLENIEARPRYLDRHLAVKELFWGGSTHPASPAIADYVAASLNNRAFERPSRLAS